MKNICLCFQMHAPYRLRRYRFFEIGQDHYYYDDMATEEHITWLVEKSYLPLAEALNEIIHLTKGKFHCALAISGTMLELFEQYTPEMIDKLKELAKSKAVELVSMPYSYSLASEYSETEWEEQLRLHKEKVENLFSLHSTTLFNPELLYSDELATMAQRLGYKTIMAEGAQQVLSYKTPNRIFQSSTAPKLKVLLRNMAWSDEISFHFSDTNWGDYPLDAEKIMNRIAQTDDKDDLINLWLGADAIGIYQPAETGIFDFFKALPYYGMEKGIRFVTPSEANKLLKSEEEISALYPLTWTGEDKGLSTFNGNDLQQEALSKLYQVTERVHMCEDSQLKRDWLLLQDMHYLHYMNHINKGDSNFDNSYDAFINYMNILADFLQQVDEQYPTTIENEELNALLKTIKNQEKEIEELKRRQKNTCRKADSNK